MKTNASLRSGSLSVRTIDKAEQVERIDLHSASLTESNAPQLASNSLMQTLNPSASTSSSSDFSSTCAQARLRLLAMLLGLFFLVSSASAQYGAWGRRTQESDVPLRCGSPRFIVKSGDSTGFALKSTEVTVNIVGVIADVQIRQVYYNSGKSPVEATYIFPASTRAAVYAMTMKVRDRVINAVVKEKEQAKQVYQQAIASGRTASLLEQLKPNVFQMSVGNIVSKDSVVVNLHYSEAIAYAEGEYEFVYPAIVGPRYAGGVSPADFQAVLSSMDLPAEIPGSFQIHCNLATGVALKKVESPSHSLDISSINAKTNAPASMADAKSITTVRPSAKALHNGNRDFVLRYRLSGPAIESGLLLSKGKDENFFMLMVQPPRQVEIPNILPREYVFIIDVSGSMWGKPIETAKKLMSDLMDKMRPTDKFNILAFSGSSISLAENSLELTPENKERARSFLNNGYGGGGTELLPALKRALAMNAAPGFSRNFVVITDGFVQCEPQAFELVRTNLNKANIYAFGIGNSVNRFLIEGLARAGNAEPMIVQDMNEAPAMADKFREYIEAPVLTNISVDFGTLDAYDVDPVSIADVSAKRPIIVFGKWKGNATGLARLHATSAQGAFDVNMDLSAEPIRPENSALRYLWARNRIRMIQDGAVNGWGYPQALALDKQKVITELGLKYNLLTDYTSFVAVDSVISVKKDQPSSVSQVKPVEATQTQNSETAVAKPGVLSTGGGIAIRGSRTAETKMLVDGQDVSDPIHGGFGTASTSTGDLRYAPSPAKAPTTNRKRSVSVESMKSLPGKAAPQSASSRDKESSANSRSGGTSSAGTSRKHKSEPQMIEQSTADDVAEDLTLNKKVIVSAEPKSTDSKTAPVPDTVGPVVVQSGPSDSDGHTVSTLGGTTVQNPIGNVRANSGSEYLTKETQSVAATVSSSEIDALGDSEASPLMAAAEKWYSGPVIRFGQSVWNEQISSGAEVRVRGQEFGRTKLQGASYGFGWTVLHPDIRSSSLLFWGIDLEYNHHSLHGAGAQDVNVWTSGSSDSARVPATIDYLTTLSDLRLGLNASLRLGRRSSWSLSAGLSPGIVLSSTTTDIATIDSSHIWYLPIESTVLPTDQSGRKVYLRDSKATSKSFLLGLHLGLQYQWKLRYFMLMPFLNYKHEILSPASNTSMYGFSTGMRVVFPIRF